MGNPKMMNSMIPLYCCLAKFLSDRKKKEIYISGNKNMKSLFLISTDAALHP